MTSIADKEKSSIVETITIEDQDSESKENISKFSQIHLLFFTFHFAIIYISEGMI